MEICVQNVSKTCTKPMNRASDKDNELASRLKLHLEEKMAWGPALSWTHHQYEELSERIQNETLVLLSVNTLKRFFGKISSNSSPGKTTLNTLAQFCGFESFYDFAEKNDVKTLKEVPVNKPAKKRLNRKTRFFGTVVLPAIILIAGSFLLYKYIIRENYFDNAQFSQAFGSGYVPFTQIFKYHVNPALTDSIYFNEYFKGTEGLSTRDSVFSWMHFVPGFRKVRFTAEDHVMWESTYMVKTKGWLYIFPWGGLEPRKYIPLNGSNGYLTVSDELLEKNKINLEEEAGWVHYFNARFFGVEGTDFMLETTIRNQLKTGFQQCQDAIIAVECELFTFKVHFTQTGCQKFAELILGGNQYGGIQNDLTKLTLDMNEWQNITLSSKNGLFSVYREDELLIEKEYSDTPGKITMLHYSFRGNGQVDDLTLTNGEGEVFYAEDFE